MEGTFSVIFVIFHIPSIKHLFTLGMRKMFKLLPPLYAVKVCFLVSVCLSMYVCVLVCSGYNVEQVDIETSFLTISRSSLNIKVMWSRSRSHIFFGRKSCVAQPSSTGSSTIFIPFSLPCDNLDFFLHWKCYFDYLDIRHYTCLRLRSSQGQGHSRAKL